MISLKSWSDVRSQWVTPERLLLLLPLIIGSGVAALMAVALYLPLLVQVNRLGQAVQGLADKVALLPANRQKLGVQLQRTAQARAQEELLLKLVAGTGQLPTLQAELSQLARRSGVAITGFEPRSGEASPGAGALKGAAPTSAPGRPKGTADPLLSAGLRKKSVLLTVNGTYPNLREFLLAVENLDVIAIATELKLTTSADGPMALPNADHSSAKTTMTLVLSTYDRPGGDPAQSAGARPRPGGPRP